MSLHNQRIHSIGAAQAFRGYLLVAIFRVVIHPRRGQSRLHLIVEVNIIDVQYPLNWDVTFCAVAYVQQDVFVDCPPPPAKVLNAI